MTSCDVTGLSSNDPQWYQAITGKLTADQIELLQSLFLYADQRRAQTGQSPDPCCHKPLNVYVTL